MNKEEIYSMLEDDKILKCFVFESVNPDILILFDIIDFNNKYLYTKFNGVITSSIEIEKYEIQYLNNKGDSDIQFFKLIKK